MDTSEKRGDTCARTTTLVVACEPSVSDPLTGPADPPAYLDLSDWKAWQQAVAKVQGPVLIWDQRLSDRALSLIPSGSQQVDHQVHLLIENRRQRSYLGTLLTWIHYWLARCLFGIRKSPRLPAAIWFADATSLQSLLKSIPPSSPRVPPTWLREKLHRWIPTAPREQMLDRLIAATALSELSLQQTEWDHPDPLPRITPWRLRLKSLSQRIAAMAVLVHDWWNWRMFPSDNPHALIQHPARRQTPRAAGPSLGIQTLAWVSLLLGAILLLGLRLDYPLFEPDEARNAQLAINILESGDWVSLQLGTEPYWDKPPAVAWGTAIAYQIFGVHAWSTRLVSNLSAILTVLATFYFGRRLIGFRAAWLGALLLLLCVGFVVCGRYATMDAAITLCATVMLGSMAMACGGERLRYGYWLLASLACGVGLLVKGPVIGVLTLPPFLMWLWLTGSSHLWRPTRWLTLAGIAMAIAGPWFAVMAIREPDFLVYFFWKHHVVRFSDAFNHREPFWFYGPVLILGTFPASLLIPTLIPLFRRFGDHCRSVRTPELGLTVLYAAWVVGFFSLSDSKLPTYILPAFPAVALLFATATLAFLSDLRAMPGHHPRFANYFLSIPRRAAVSVSIAVVAFWAVSHWLLNQNPMGGWFGLLAGLGIGLSLLAWTLRPRVGTVASFGLILSSLFVITITGYVLPGVSTLRSIQRTTAKLQDNPSLRNLPVVFYNHEDYGCQLWLADEKIAGFDDYNFVAMLTFLEQHPRCLIVSRLEEMEVLRTNLDTNAQLSSIRGARHLYLYQSSQDVVPDRSDTTGTSEPLIDLSDRLKPVTFTR